MPKYNTLRTVVVLGDTDVVIVRRGNYLGHRRGLRLLVVREIPEYLSSVLHQSVMTKLSNMELLGACRLQPWCHQVSVPLVPPHYHHVDQMAGALPWSTNTGSCVLRPLWLILASQRRSLEPVLSTHPRFGGVIHQTLPGYLTCRLPVHTCPLRANITGSGKK